MDRQLIRMNESLESVKTISECIKRCGRWNRRSRYLQNLLITNMESMIHYFKLVSEGYTFGCSETYLRQEAPKGELGSQVLSGIIKPDRVKIRSPDYYNLQALNIISTDHYLADLIASLGTADFVLGSIDRIGYLDLKPTRPYFDEIISKSTAIRLIGQLHNFISIAEVQYLILPGSITFRR